MDMVYEKDITHLSLEDTFVYKMAKFWCNITPDSHLMQFTGLQDILSNDLYEDDLITAWIVGTLNEKPHIETLKIVFKVGTFCAVNERRSIPLSKLCKKHPLNKYYECSLIGNIHQHPHLLKPQE